MQGALKKAGVYFDFVGMDCCLMSCLEVCCAFYDYCDYMVLSEDFESGLGWSYTKWLKTLYKNTSTPTLDLGKLICDEMVKANETQEGGDKSSMTVIDESMLKVLYRAWTDFAYANENQLLGANYSRSTKRVLGGRVLPSIARKGKHEDWNNDFYSIDDYGESEDDNLNMAEYFVTDIMEVAKSVESEESKALKAAINATLCYVKNTESDAHLTGISVSLPYGDKEYYKSLKTIFKNIGLDDTYITWLKKFTQVKSASSEDIHNRWDESWEGWDQYEDEYNWEESEYTGYDDDYWEDCYNWDDWKYEDSWNEWSCDNQWEPSSDWSYEDDDRDEQYYDEYDEYEDYWYYGDDYWYGDDWYEDDSYYEDDRYDEEDYDDGYYEEDEYDW